MNGAPQVEDGYTRIANELLEALVKAKLTGREFRIMLAMARLTYGWQQKARKLSYGDVAKECGISRRHTLRLMRELAARNFLWSQSTKYGKPHVWGIQKTYAQWDCGQLVPEKAPVMHSGAGEGTSDSAGDGTRTSAVDGTSRWWQPVDFLGLYGRLKKGKKGKKKEGGRDPKERNVDN